MPETPAVEFRHLTKTFGTRRVLDDLCLVVPRGRAVCLLGRSGTGKSVTLKHIIGLMRADAGSVLVDGEDMATLNPRELTRVRKRIGLLFQNGALFDSISVGENVAFPMRRHLPLADAEIRARATHLLAQVGLGREYDKIAGRPCRAACASAPVWRGPWRSSRRLLLADEPSAGLDPVTAGEIDQLLVDLKHRTGTTLIVVTHNIPSARVIGDELVFLHEGRVLAQGDAAALERSESALVRQFMQSAGAG